MEPKPQVEIQLGHMCNNRCVFCVSGQRSAMREAFPTPAAPVIEKLREARAQGITKLTLLGGEPTLQPEFMDVLRAARALEFDEVVVFTNGVKTARAAYVDEVLAACDRVTWRISLQGATGAAHDRTTRKLGSFQRIRETLAHLQARAQTVTVNMCVVRSNHESVEHFPALLLPHGVRQLHLDMVRPMDAGERTEDELRAMVPRYSDLAPALTRMIAGFPEGFDVNIGNLPYCTAPALAPFIHHDGEPTLTVAVDGQDQLSEPWDKYAVKRRDKLKPESCSQCVFDPQCSGVFETYARFYGTDELVPVTAEGLVVLDPARRLFTLHAAPWVAALSNDFAPPAPFEPAPAVRTDSRAGEVTLRFDAPRGAYVQLALRRPDGAGVAGTEAFSLHLLEARDAGEHTLPLVRAVFARLCAASGARVRYPVALGRGLDPRLAACLARLRAAAPHGSLDWHRVDVAPGGRAAELALTDPEGHAVAVSLVVREPVVSGSYKLAPGAVPTRALAEGVRHLLDALRTR